MKTKHIIKNSCGGKGCYIKSRILPTDSSIEPLYSKVYAKRNDTEKVLFVFSAIMG